VHILENFVTVYPETPYTYLAITDTWHKDVIHCMLPSI